LVLSRPPILAFAVLAKISALYRAGGCQTVLDLLTDCRINNNRRNCSNNKPRSYRAPLGGILTNHRLQPYSQRSHLLFANKGYGEPLVLPKAVYEAAAVIEQFNPGMLGGTALAELLFGLSSRKRDLQAVRFSVS
jgi:hypothetical protein